LHFLSRFRAGLKCVYNFPLQVSITNKKSFSLQVEKPAKKNHYILNGGRPRLKWFLYISYSITTSRVGSLLVLWLSLQNIFMKMKYIYLSIIHKDAKNMFLFMHHTIQYSKLLLYMDFIFWLCLRFSSKLCNILGPTKYNIGPVWTS
jgi:hypothetical protein